MVKSIVTNQRVAEDLGLTHSGVSRIRSGDRLPSISVMIKVEEVLGWRVQSQVQVIAAPRKYAQEFETFLCKKYGAVDAASRA